jgi:hypothetical protein
LVEHRLCKAGVRGSIPLVSTMKIGFADQDFSFELVPLELMKNNPNNLDLATPSIAFHVSNLEQTRSMLIEKGVQVTELADHGGITSFAFIDNEGRGFAVLNSK